MWSTYFIPSRFTRMQMAPAWWPYCPSATLLNIKEKRERPLAFFLVETTWVVRVCLKSWKLRRQGYDDIELKHALKITYLPSILNHFCRTMTSSCHFFVDKQWRFKSRTPDDAWVHCLPQRKGRFCHRGNWRGTKGCGGKGVGGHHARSKVPEDIHGSLRFVNHPGTLPQATVVHPSEFVSDDCRSKINVVNLVS